jgi:hypothetical protein
MENVTATTLREEQVMSPQKNDNATAVPEKGTGLTFNPLKFGVATVVAALTVLLVFLANQVYLFGSTFNQASRNHAFTIAAVNYDGDNSAVWNAFSEAYAALASDIFATVIWIANPINSNFSTPDHLVDAVRNRAYWGAVCIPPGASSRLDDAVSGQVGTFNASDAVTYIWNKIRYPSVSASIVKLGVLKLQVVAQSIYQAGAIACMLRGATGLHPETAISAYVSPFNATEINDSPSP